MNGRFSYYYQKAKIRLKKSGFATLTKDFFCFLWRRKFFLQFAQEAFEYHVLAPRRDPNATILRVLQHAQISSERVMLYASFDAGSQVRPHVVQQLSAFQDQGYQNIFISTSPELSPAQFNKIKGFASIIIHRRNEGYDFVSWKVGQSFILDQMKSIRSLILMNDSCFGPAYDLSATLKVMQDSADSVYGISKSEEISEHIQSYFYHFGANVIRMPVLKLFFSRIRILHHKWGIVRYLEIGGSRFLLSHAIPLKALIDASDPIIKNKMKSFGLTEPTREPLASDWVSLKISPFYKRSNEVSNGPK